MASQQKTELLKIGPWLGLDSTTSPPFVEPGKAASMSNVDMVRYPKGFSTAPGRQNLFGSTNTIFAMGLFEPCQPERMLVFSTTGAGTYAYSTVYGTIGLISNATQFTQAVQYNLALYTNYGQQIIQAQYYYSGGSYSGGPGTTPLAYRWQYQFQQSATNSITVAPGVGTQANGTYYYAFTLEIFLPGVPNYNILYGLGTQETSAFGAIPAINGTYPYQVTLGAPHSAVVTIGNASLGANIWNGTFPDGGKWYINIYRQSSNQPTWFLVASSCISGTNVAGLTNGVAFTDNVPDATIQGNQQLNIYQDPPHISVQQSLSGNAYAFNFIPTQGAIFTHKERMWAFGLVNTGAGTFGITQSQLWYSGYGTPWSFNSVNQVLLVGNDDVPLTSEIDSFTNDVPPAAAGPGVYAAGIYGDAPVAGASLSSVGVLFMRKSLWILYGDDETTFIARKVGEYGCVDGRSAAVCQGIVFWASEEGVFSFDGASAPQYVSEDIRESLRQAYLASAAQAQVPCVAWFANRCYYLSFPVANQTFIYSLVYKQWMVRPYSTYSSIAIPNQPSPIAQNSPLDAIFAVRAGTPSGGVQTYTGAIDVWDNVDSDLGFTVEATWASPLSDSGKPGILKQYERIVVNAPIQSVTIQVTLTIDPGSNPAKVYTWNVNLNNGPSNVWTVPTDCTGYLAQVSLSVESNGPAPFTPTQIYSVAVVGNMQNDMVAYDNGGVY